jgi:glycosyltransferase involved in cell wall biosynthesis
VVSVHGHDVYGPDAASPQVRATLAHAAMVLANTEGTARRSMDSGAAATRTRVVHLGSDLPPEPAAPPGSPPVLVSVGNLIERKRHADVVAALPRLRRRHPGLRYVVVGDGPERERLRGLAASLGVLDAVDLRGRLAHAQALAVARGSTLFVLPSVDEAFGVSYVEAMAAGVPAIGTAGEDGPREIERSGGGIELVAPRDPPALAAAIDALLSDPSRLKAMGRTARETVRREFTWEQCGRRTAEAYAAASVQRRQRQ